MDTTMRTRRLLVMLFAASLVGCKDSKNSTNGVLLARDQPQDPVIKAIEFVQSRGGGTVRDKDQPGEPIVSVTLRGKEVTDSGLELLAALRSEERRVGKGCGARV